MFELVRDKAAVLVGALLLWFAWGAVDVEEKKAAGKEKLPVIGAEVLEVRARDAPVPQLHDPFGVELARSGALSHRPRRPSFLAPLRARLLTAGASLDAALTEGVVEELVPLLREAGPVAPLLLAARLPPGDAPAPLPSFALQLQSVVSFGDGRGRARINGANVEPGALLDAYDPAEPPEVLSVAGLSVTLAYREQVLVLDLDARPVVHVVSGVAMPDGVPAAGGGS